jgi:hypothetical protein
MVLNGKLGVALKSVGLGLGFAFVSFVLSGSDASLPMGFMIMYMNWQNNNRELYNPQIIYPKQLKRMKKNMKKKLIDDVDKQAVWVG